MSSGVPVAIESAGDKHAAQDQADYGDIESQIVEAIGHS
jgi:hypothetical protein